MRSLLKPAHLLALVLSLFVWGGAHAQCATGAPGQQPTATLTFQAVTLNTDGSGVATPVTYNLYQGLSAATLTKVAGATITPGTGNSIKTGLAAGNTYYFAVSAVDANGTEGAQSPAVCKTFPKAVPNATTVTIT